MKQKFKNLAKNLALSATSFLLCLLLLELVLRFCGYGNVEIYAADPKLFWRLKPNQHCYTKIGRKPVRINSMGTRGAEFDLRKPLNTVRILSLGDSTAFGWGLSEDETYAARLEKILNANITNGKHFEVINAGVNAWSYTQILSYLRNDAVKYSPDYLLLGGANLWTQFSENSSPDFVRAMMLRVKFKNFLRHFALYHYLVEVQLESVYQKYRTRFIPIDPKNDQLFKEQQRSDPNKVFEDAIRGVCDVAKSNQIKPVLLFIPIQNQLGTTNDPIRAIKINTSKTLGVPLLDFTEVLRPFVEQSYLEGDPVHLNARGNEIVAGQLLEFFKSQRNLL